MMTHLAATVCGRLLALLLLRVFFPSMVPVFPLLLAVLTAGARPAAEEAVVLGPVPFSNRQCEKKRRTIREENGESGRRWNTLGGCLT